MPFLCRTRRPSHHTPAPGPAGPRRLARSLALSWLLVPPAHALEAELGLGISRFTLAANGTWYQDGNAYDVNLNSPAFAVGLRSDRDLGWGWRAGYEYLGRVTSKALASASDDDYFSGRNAWPLSHWNGSGTVQGVYGGVLYRLQRWGIAIEPEAGMYLYRPTWEMHIPDWRACQTCTPQPVHVRHDAGVQGTWYAGVALGPFSVRYYGLVDANGDQWPAIYDGPVWQVQVRVCFGKQQISFC